FLAGYVRPVLAAGACLVACGVIVWYWSQGGAVAAPQCVFDQPVIDLGELPPGNMKYTIPVRNGGTVPLQISKVLSTCTCAAGKAPEVVEPGQIGVLEVALNIPPGPQGARIMIESNDPEGPKTVSLSWHSKATPKLIPYKVEAQGISVGQPYERIV